MLHNEELQLDLENGGVKTVIIDKVAKSIDRLRCFEPPEGYYLAFSGGKDSQCIYHLAKEAGVKFDAHYNVTTVDPPELIYFIRGNYPDVIFDKKPGVSMWKLIVEKGAPPTRLMRYCCSKLKESGGERRVVITGVRWAESVKRRSRQAFEIVTKKKNDKVLYSDNVENRMLFETCIKKGRRTINPIIDWEDNDVWEFILSRNLKYCCLYEQGFTRIGCIGCPMHARTAREMERYPKYKAAYLRAFKRMIDKHGYADNSHSWKTPESVMKWWLERKSNKVLKGQLELEGISLEDWDI